MGKEWTKVGEVEINRPASDSAVEVRNPSYIKNVGEFYQSPIDERGTDHLLTCYAEAERDDGSVSAGDHADAADSESRQTDAGEDSESR